MAAATGDDPAPPFDELAVMAAKYRSASSAASAAPLLAALRRGVAPDCAERRSPSPVQLVECVTGKLDMIQLAASPAGELSRQYGVPAAGSIPLCGVLPALASSGDSGTRKAAAALAVACLHTAAAGDSQRATAGALRCVHAALRGDAELRGAVYQAVAGPSTAASATPLLAHAWKDGCGWLSWGLGPMGARLERCILRDAAHVHVAALQWALRRWAGGSASLATPRQVAHVVGAIAQLASTPGVGATLPHVLGARGGEGVTCSVPLLRSRLPAVHAEDAIKAEGVWQEMVLGSAALEQARALLSALPPAAES